MPAKLVGLCSGPIPHVMAYYINNVICLLTVNSPVTGSKPTCIMCSKSTGFEISGLYALSGKSQSGSINS